MNKFIVLTGATGGMGAEVLKQLINDGRYNVFVTYRSEKQLDYFLKMKNQRIIPLYADLTRSEDILNLCTEVQKRIDDEGLYALVNCAGLANATPLEYASEENARELMEVNYFAPMLLTKHLLPLLKQYKQKNELSPRVLNIASWAGVVAQPFIPFYNASKFAIMGFSESIYYDLGLDNIYVVSIIPGITKTPLLSKTTHSAFQAIAEANQKEKNKYEKNFMMFSTDPSEGSMAKFLSSSDQAASKIVSVLEKRHPKSRYAIAADAKFMDAFVSRIMPVKLRLKMMKFMYKLEG